MSPENARAQLHAAGAAAGTPPTHLARTVLATRRHRRRRTTVISGAVLAVLLVAVGVPAALTGTRQPSTSAVAAGGGGPVYTLPPRGPLAGEVDLLIGLQQLPWAPTDPAAGTAYRSYDAANPPASSGYYVSVDLAAAVPADQRHVVWVGDVPGGRWALLAIPTDGGQAAAWFVGPAGADADQMRISGPVQLVADDEPMAHVDLTNPDKTLVVVAAPGDVPTISDAVSVQADGSTVQEYRELSAEDGVAVTTLDTPVRYGVPATVQVSSASGSWQAQPTAAGQTSGVPWGTSFGYGDDDPETPSIQLTRNMSGLAVGRVLNDTMLASVLGPTGLTLQDIDDNGPQISEIFSGTRDGSLPDPFSGDPADEQGSQAPIIEPSIAIWDLRLPSGAQAVMAGWSVVEDTDTTQDPEYEQTLLTVLGPDFDPAVDLVAHRMDLPAVDGRPAETIVVVAGDPAGATARLLDDRGDEVASVNLQDGTATEPDPEKVVDRVEILDSDGKTLQAGQLLTGVVELAPDGDEPTFLTTPITASASAGPSGTPAESTPITVPPPTNTPPSSAPPLEEFGQRMSDCLRPLGFEVTIDASGTGLSVDQALADDPAFQERLALCAEQTGYAPS